MSLCLATFETASGEYVSPCHKEKGHDGHHEGFVLGNRCTWMQGISSEQELAMMSETEYRQLVIESEARNAGKS